MPLPLHGRTLQAMTVSVSAQEALVRGALSGADVLLWLLVRAIPVVGWVCMQWPAFRCARTGGACIRWCAGGAGLQTFARCPGTAVMLWARRVGPS